MLNNDFGILLVSRNNPDMIEEWYKQYDYTNIEILNIDESTNTSCMKLIEKKCSDLGMHYQYAVKMGMGENIKQAIYFFNKKKIDWILYMHHDAYPLEDNTLLDISKYIKSNSLIDFGVIGFNVYHGDYDLPHWEAGDVSCHTTARSPLEIGDGWYRKLPHLSSRIKYQDNKRPFAVESVMWSTALINGKSFQNNIKIDSKFVFFHAWDDIAFQYLNKNIYNVVIPTIIFAHDQRLKLKHKLPYSSPQGQTKDVREMYGRNDHLEVWKNKWGFSWDLKKAVVFGIDLNSPWFIRIMRYFFKGFIPLLPTVVRLEYKVVQKRYKDTLIDKFYNHDPKNGPLKYFDL